MRLVRFTVNWLVLLTVPIWFVPVFIGIAIMTVLDPNRDRSQYNIVTGNTWIA